MRLNSMLATVLIFLCSLVISSCSNDELAPISLKNRETANIKLNYPNNQTYSFPLQGGDGNYEISCDKPEIIETKMISSCDISIKALALGEAIITVKDQSGNTLDIHVIVDYYTDNYIVSKHYIPSTALHFQFPWILFAQWSRAIIYLAKGKLLAIILDENTLTELLYALST